MSEATGGQDEAEPGENARRPGDGETGSADRAQLVVFAYVWPRSPRPAPVGQYPRGRRRSGLAAPWAVSEAHPLGGRLEAHHSRPLGP
jgi:hypothetical protein